MKRIATGIIALALGLVVLSPPVHAGLSESVARQWSGVTINFGIGNTWASNDRVVFRGVSPIPTAFGQLGIPIGSLPLSFDGEGGGRLNRWSGIYLRGALVWHAKRTR